MDELRVVELQTLMIHAPHGDGCKCGWTGADFMEHVEAALKADVIAAGLDWREDGD